MFAKLFSAFTARQSADSVRVGLDRLAILNQEKARNAWASRDAAWRKETAYKVTRPIDPNTPMPIRAR